jgi:hypothetical protein
MPTDKFPGDSRPSPALAVTGNDFHGRYLAAKKGIDDRALNRHVWDTLRATLSRPNGRGPLKILEIGAGIGTMLTRVIDWGLLTGPATYVLSDCEKEHLMAARGYLAKWAERQGYDLSWRGGRHGLLRAAAAEVALVFAVAGAEEVAAGTDSLGRFDLLLAHAVLDLLDFPAVLPGLLRRLEEGGLAYLTCNFDGETIFLPEYDGEEETEILRLYHASMDNRRPGASRTGRRLLTFLQGSGLELLAAGSSDWLIHPRNRRYRGEETIFLQAILATVEQELAGTDGLPPLSLAAWAGRRQQQLLAGKLTFFARHLDFLARRGRPLP